MAGQEVSQEEQRDWRRTGRSLEVFVLNSQMIVGGGFDSTLGRGQDARDVGK